MSGEFDYEFQEVQCPTARGLLDLRGIAGDRALQVEAMLESRRPEERVEVQRVTSQLRNVAQAAGSAVLGCTHCYGNGKFAGYAECLPRNVSRLGQLKDQYDSWQPQASALLRDDPEE
jgi:hypothetical protein